MITALAILLACQLAGEITVRALGLPLPGPVLGMLLLTGLPPVVSSRMPCTSITAPAVSALRPPASELSKMVAVVTTLLEEQGRRRDAGDLIWRIPFRPDHGHELLDDVGKAAFPGYSAIGRLKGMAEIRGVMTAVASLRGLPI